jgi:hypothetical protein
MIPINVLELALHDPSRRTADLAGHPRHPAHQPHRTHALRRARRLIPHSRPTTEHEAARNC